MLSIAFVVRPERLAPICREALEPPGNQIWVTSISVLEIFLKAKIGKLRVPQGLIEAIVSQGMQSLPFTVFG